MLIVPKRLREGGEVLTEKKKIKPPSERNNTLKNDVRGKEKKTQFSPQNKTNPVERKKPGRREKKDKKKLVDGRGGGVNFPLKKTLSQTEGERPSLSKKLFLLLSETSADLKSPSSPVGGLVLTRKRGKKKTG